MKKTFIILICLCILLGVSSCYFKPNNSEIIDFESSGDFTSRESYNTSKEVSSSSFIENSFSSEISNENSFDKFLENFTQIKVEISSGFYNEFIKTIKYNPIDKDFYYELMEIEKKNYGEPKELSDLSFKYLKIWEEEIRKTKLDFKSLLSNDTYESLSENIDQAIKQFHNDFDVFYEIINSDDKVAQLFTYDDFYSIAMPYYDQLRCLTLKYKYWLYLYESGIYDEPDIEDLKCLKFYYEEVH